MEKILVGVDFSESSKNAAAYAVKFASYFSAQVTLINAFSMPVPYPESGVVFSIDEYEKEAKEGLSKLKAELHKQVPQIDIQLHAKLGEGEDVIREELESNKYDLVILGINPNVGELYEYFIGSTATALARDAKVPVLIVPNHLHFFKIKKLGYAADYNKNYQDSHVLIFLKYFTKVFEAELSLINVVTDKDKYTLDIIKHEEYINQYLDQIHPKTIYSSNKDIAEGLIDVAKQNNLDLLVTSPAKHHYFYEWYHESNTKKLAFHINIPLLCLPFDM